MSEENVYAAPTSEPQLAGQDTSDPQFNTDAGRGSRLLAYIVDIIIPMVIVMPIAFAFGMFAISIDSATGELQTASFLITNIVFPIFFYAVFIGVNAAFLFKSGQTIGKKLLKIKIVSVNGSQASAASILIRYAVLFFLGSVIPIIGGILSLISVLLIFGAERRCGHDIAGATRVVNNS